MLEGAAWTAVYENFTIYVKGERKGVSAHLVDRDDGILSGRWQSASILASEEEAKQVALAELNRRIGNGTITSLDWIYSAPPPPTVF